MFRIILLKSYKTFPHRFFFFISQNLLKYMQNRISSFKNMFPCYVLQPNLIYLQLNFSNRSFILLIVVSFFQPQLRFSSYKQYVLYIKKIAQSMESFLKYRKQTNMFKFICSWGFLSNILKVFIGLVATCKKNPIY